MGYLHWFILIPFYFFGSLAALPFLIVVCRLLRLKVSNFIASLQEYRNDMVAKGAYDFSVPPSENVGR